MNITLPYSWIRDYLQTTVKPEKVFRLLTQVGPTVERVEKLKDDYLLDIEVTINRPDCLSVLGIAREMYTALVAANLPATLTNDCLSNPPKIPINPKLLPVPFKFTIDTKLCPRFMGVLLTGVKITPSPDSITSRLAKAGMRGLNNVIDITNFLMLETGQPNHAFDFDKITGPKFLIRSAKNGETLVTLDGKNRDLAVGDIIYEDEDKIFDLSGIMGGQPSEIGSQTKNVFFTVANDYFAQIRKTSMRLGIQTEAAARLSKVLNPEIVSPVFYRGLELLLKHTGATIGSQIYDSYPQPQAIPVITTNDQQLSRLNGVFIPARQTDAILTNLGFTINRDTSQLTIRPPTWRITDITCWQDIAEEVARVYNYDNIPNQIPAFPLPTKSASQSTPFLLEDRIRHTLVSWGFTETMSFSMLSLTDITNTGSDPATTLKIANPLSQEWEYMQPSLLPNMLKNFITNQTIPDLALFEIANVFAKSGHESRILSMGISADNFYLAKGYLDTLLLSLHYPANYSPTSIAIFSEPISAIVNYHHQPVGFLGLVSRTISTNYKLSSPVVYAQVDLSALLKQPISPPVYHSIAKYAPIIEDLSFVIPPTTTYEQVEIAIRAITGITQVSLLDHYHQYFTFRVHYNLKDKQISSVESQQIRRTLLLTLDKSLSVKLRTA